MVEAFNTLTYADLALALYYARKDTSEDHPTGPGVKLLEVQVTALKEAVAKAEAISEQRRQEAEAARMQIAGMAVEIETLSKQTAKQSAANNKLQTEFDSLRARFNAYWQRECAENS
jgi:hypothetical protein